MAKWRAICSSITTDEAVIELSDPDQLLYERMIIKADDWGVITGNIKSLKIETIPVSSRNFQEIDGALQEMEELSLIWRYQPEGFRPLIQIRKFDEHQPGELVRKRTVPKLPLHPDWRPTQGDDRSVGLLKEVADLIPGISEILREITGKVRLEQNRQEQTRGEEKRTDKSKSREDQSPADVPVPSLRIFNLLECLGIRNPKRDQLAGLEHVTEAYLEGWNGAYQRGEFENLKNPTGYVVTCIQRGDPPP